ncbi:uncharacterized protein LOC114297861 isoform X1 [Camellia sinensis]|uniref:uncharacterized protein LOC114297861 isoform X1 n=1 Tax=Camellia sinensis TaxID=4442 RepID=UPI0010360712|nr:uncharacterized protein LOC114297861 isoform X1 [Camellia sinensis]
MGFGLNNHLAVWKLIPEEMKRKLTATYENYGDGAIIWAGTKEDVFVHFSNIRNLVCLAGVKGNVIDAYTELLLSEQDVLAAGVEFPEKSYFFTNICLDMAKHTSVTSRDKYIEIHMRAADDVR